MIDSQEDFPKKTRSPWWVLAALGLVGILLLIAMLLVGHWGYNLGGRHTSLAAADDMETELMRAFLAYEQLLDDATTSGKELVSSHLMRADQHAERLAQTCLSEQGQFFLAPVAPLRRELTVLRLYLTHFRELTDERLEALGSSPNEIGADAMYEEAFRQLDAQIRVTKAAADEVMRIERAVLNTSQTCLIAGALVLAGLIAMMFAKFLKRRQQVEDALAESEERFRSLYRDSSDAIMLLDENSFFDCNEATLRVFQLDSYKQFCRKHPADLSPLRQPDGSESTTRANERIATALREGVHRFEWTHQRADGSDFPAEVLLSAVHVQGRKVLQAVVRDVTQRRDSEERLKSNELKLRSISDAALDAVIMMDARGKAVHWNPAAEKMFGYSSEEVFGKDIHGLLTPARLQQSAFEALSHFYKTGEGRAVGRILELQAVRKGGEEFPVEISLAPIHIGDGWCSVAVVRDITDRKLAHEKLRAEQHTLRRMLKAHDQERKLIAYDIHDGLAQQLVAAIMQCQAVTHTGPEEQKTLASELLGLLRKCLSETRRLISGVRPPILDEFGVVTAIQSLREETEARGGPEIEFQSDVSFERLEPVLENTIYRVIQESLGNACRHSQSPRVLIELAEHENHIQIRVQDWGVGFDPGEVDRGRYGLAGIRERARLLGGDVIIESQLGAGTTVTVELPLDVGDLGE